MDSENNRSHNETRTGYGDTASNDNVAESLIGVHHVGPVNEDGQDSEGSGDESSGSEETGRIRLALIYDGENEYIQMPWKQVVEIFDKLTSAGAPPMQALDGVRKFIFKMLRYK